MGLPKCYNQFPVLPCLETTMPDNSNSSMRDCVVKLVDFHGVEHSVRGRAESVYEAALWGLERLNRVAWESDGSQMGFVVVEVYEEPTTHTVNVKRLLDWLKQP